MVFNIPFYLGKFKCTFRRIGGKIHTVMVYYKLAFMVKHIINTLNVDEYSVQKCISLHSNFKTNE